MSNAIVRHRSVRCSLLLGAATAAVFGATGTAFAQDNGSVETVVVTGSRIPQQGLYSSSPITVIGSQEAQLQGAVNVADLLNRLPQNIEGETSGSDLVSTGETTVNLRGLGSARTLVLVDSKRFTPSSIGGYVDLDSIPSSIIDHIEVVTGGASAVYGSDAEAGVVNIILKRDFEGFQVDGTYNVNVPYNDGATNAYNALLGINSANGKGNITMYAGYLHQDPVWQRTRKWAEPEYVDNPTKTALEKSGSQASPDGLFYLASGPNAFTGLPNGLVAPTTAGNFRPDCSLSCVPSSDPFAADDFFNPNDYEMLQSQQTRYDFGAEGHYEISKQLELYMRAMYSDNQRNTQIGPPNTGFKTFTVTGDNNYLSNQEKDIIFGTHTGLTSGDVGTFYLLQRLVGVGGRRNDYDIQNMQIVVGAKGDLGDGWSYDFSGQFGRSTNWGFSKNYASATNYQKLIDCGSPALAAPGCPVYNMFHPVPGGGFSTAAANYLRETYQDTNVTQETVITGSVNGDLGSIGGQSPWAKNPIAVSMGAEYRQEFAQVNPDETLQQGNALGLSAAVPPAQGTFNVTEGFGEVRIPVVQAQPFFQDLSLEGAYRYSSYSTAGSVSTYKYGLTWAPTDDIKFRALTQRAVRAPNIAELYNPNAISLTVVKDPCAATQHPTGNLLTLCNLTGVPLNGGGTNTTLGACASNQCNYLIGGNLALAPEVDNTKTIGFVFTPTFFDGFTATVDYYSIKIKNAINVYAGGSGGALNACYNPVGGFTSAAAQAATPACSSTFIHRNAGGGFIGSGSTAGYILGTSFNTGLLEPKGIDYDLAYQTDLSTFGASADAGSISWNFNGTHLLNWKQIGGPHLPTYDCAGYFGNTCATAQPRDRFTTRLNWQNSDSDLVLSADMQFIGGMKLDQNYAKFGGTSSTFDKVDGKLPNEYYFDLSGIWTVTQGVELTAGVNNIFDRDPPVISSAFDPNVDNTLVSVYPLTGRNVFVSASFKY